MSSLSFVSMKQNLSSDRAAAGMDTNRLLAWLSGYSARFGPEKNQSTRLFLVLVCDTQALHILSRQRQDTLNFMTSVIQLLRTAAPEYVNLIFALGASVGLAIGGCILYAVMYGLPGFRRRRRARTIRVPARFRSLAQFLTRLTSKFRNEVP